MSKYIIGLSANGKQVYANLTRKSLEESVSRNPRLLGLVATAVNALALSGKTVTISHDMGHNIGYSEILKTQEKDTIFYAQTSKLPVYTRFVKLREAEKSSTITLQLHVDEVGDYQLTNVWIGADYPPKPSTEISSSQSKDYWKSHAIVFNGQSLLASTITKVCPY